MSSLTAYDEQTVPRQKCVLHVPLLAIVCKNRMPSLSPENLKAINLGFGQSPMSRRLNLTLYPAFFARDQHSRKKCSICPESMLNLPGGDVQSHAEYSLYQHGEAVYPFADICVTADDVHMRSTCEVIQHDDSARNSADRVASSAPAYTCTFTSEISSEAATGEMGETRCSSANSAACCSCAILKILLCQ